MTNIRSLPWAVAVLAALLASIPAFALESFDDTLAIEEEVEVAEEISDEENVGEPAAEDAPVEGEPGPGDAITVPPEDPTGAADAPAADGSEGDMPAE
jgi:hypothetical protein